MTVAYRTLSSPAEIETNETNREATIFGIIFAKSRIFRDV